MYYLLYAICIVITPIFVNINTGISLLAATDTTEIIMILVPQSELYHGAKLSQLLSVNQTHFNFKVQSYESQKELHDQIENTTNAYLVVAPKAYTKQYVQSNKILPISTVMEDDINTFMAKFESLHTKQHCYSNNKEQVYSLPLVRMQLLCLYKLELLKKIDSFPDCENLTTRENECGFVLENLRDQHHIPKEPLFLPATFYPYLAFKHLEMKNNRLHLNKDTATKDIQRWLNWYRAGKLGFSPSCSTATTAFSSTQENVDILNVGQCAMILCLSDASNEFYSKDNAEQKHLEIANPTDKKTKSTPLEGLNLYVTNRTPKTYYPVISQFLHQIYDTQYYTQKLENKGYIPVLKQVNFNYLNKTSNPQRYGQAFPNSVAPNLPFEHEKYEEIIQILQTNLAAVFLSNIDLNEGLNNIQQAFDDL